MIHKLKLKNKDSQVDPREVPAGHLAMMQAAVRYVYLPDEVIKMIQPTATDHFSILTEMGMVLEVQGNAEKFVEASNNWRARKVGLVNIGGLTTH